VAFIVLARILWSRDFYVTLGFLKSRVTYVNEWGVWVDNFAQGFTMCLVLNDCLMTKLANKLDKESALKKLRKELFERKTVSFYKYVRLSDVERLRDELYRAWDAMGVMGRIYLAEEGVNAQLSCPEPNWEMFTKHLFSFREFRNVPFKVGLEDGESFWKLSIRVKKQIVADGLTAEDYDFSKVGNHLTAAEFNEALAQEDTIVVDMRNAYESRIGHFVDAICPDVDTFKEELPLVRDLLKGKEDKKVLLYCTGGIRCEKASAYLKNEGFADVNQLHGGIIAYKHQVEREGLESKFKGKNYVFDGRSEERVTDDVLSECDMCGESWDGYVNCKNVVCNLLFLQCEQCSKKMQGCCSEECEMIIQLSDSEYRAYRKKVGSKKRYGGRLRPRLIVN
jgi:UPF0176 protein